MQRFGLKNDLGTDAEPDLAGFKDADKDSHHKVYVLCRGVAGRRRKVQAAAAEEAVQTAFVPHDHSRQRAMKERDHEAQQQSCKFHNHHRDCKFGRCSPTIGIKT